MDLALVKELGMAGLMAFFLYHHFTYIKELVNKYVALTDDVVKALTATTEVLRATQTRLERLAVAVKELETTQKSIIADIEQEEIK